MSHRHALDHFSYTQHFSDYCPLFSVSFRRHRGRLIVGLYPFGLRRKLRERITRKKRYTKFVFSVISHPIERANPNRFFPRFYRHNFTSSSSLSSSFEAISINAVMNFAVWGATNRWKKKKVFVLFVSVALCVRWTKTLDWNIGLILQKIKLLRDFIPTRFFFRFVRFTPACYGVHSQKLV